LESGAKQLDLSSLNLTTIPPELGALSNLTTLFLSDNQITELPPELGALSNLTTLYLHGNELLGIPNEILGPTWLEVGGGSQPANPKDILDYYFRIKEGRKPLNETKLILVGFGNVGKTSLVNRLLFNQFSQNEKKTEGINKES
jgi:internalin A